MKSSLKAQVSRILAESPGRVHNVIVQMGEPGVELQPILDASTEALHRRHLSMSPRELVPPSAHLVRDKRELGSGPIKGIPICLDM